MLETIFHLVLILLGLLVLVLVLIPPTLVAIFITKRRKKKASIASMVSSMKVNSTHSKSSSLTTSQNMSKQKIYQMTSRTLNKLLRQNKDVVRSADKTVVMEINLLIKTINDVSLLSSNLPFLPAEERKFVQIIDEYLPQTLNPYFLLCRSAYTSGGNKVEAKVKEDILAQIRLYRAEMNGILSSLQHFLSGTITAQRHFTESKFSISQLDLF